MKWLTQKLNLSETAVVMCAALGGLFAFFLAAGLAVSTLVYPFERPLPYALGLFLGFLVSAVKLVLMERSIGRSVNMEEKKAQNYAGLMAALRYILTVAALLPVFFFRDLFGMWGAIIGLLSLQMAAYITGYVMKKRG